MKTARFGAIVTVISVISLIGMQYVYLETHILKRSQIDVELQGQYTSRRLNQLKIFSRLPHFGFQNLFANWAFLGFLQYFGDDEIREQTGYEFSPEFFKVVLQADPYYKDFYVFASGSTTLYAGRPDLTVTLLEEGLRFLAVKRPPDAYFIWRYKGTDELLFLGDIQSATQSFTMSADWADAENTPESKMVAEASRNMAKALEQKPYSRQVAISAWANIYISAFDRATQERAINEIRRLGGDIKINANGEIQLISPPE
jgi:hypothetical protein